MTSQLPDPRQFGAPAHRHHPRSKDSFWRSCFTTALHALLLREQLAPPTPTSDEGDQRIDLPDPVLDRERAVEHAIHIADLALDKIRGPADPKEVLPGDKRPLPNRPPPNQVGNIPVHKTS